ncbi:LysR family transcriptional regulator [Nodosilinea nodulosa]|uniref:LysR family transcriptional regulator n=1 Tax=Nodosilinea nodulosa TaxID=416001 RepID=UPI0002F8C6AA|nr:LysR family transcriptional regulator [Nodosilinea nodulosa]
MAVPPSESASGPSGPSWDDLDFGDLKLAVAVADQQGFVQAAKHLGLDQGFLSRQIKRLETRLKFELFDRTRRSPLAPTDAGQAFLKEARLILAQTAQAIEAAQQISRGEKGRLIVGINTSIANSKLPDILRSFYARYPEVTLVLQELASYDQIEKLKQQQLDVGFFHAHNLRTVEGNHGNLDLETQIVLREPLILILPEKHRFASQATGVAIASLAKESFILPPANLLYGLRDQIDQLCLEAGFKPKVKQEAAWISTVLSLVAGGVGISILPANVKNLQRHGVVYRSILGSSPELEIVAAWHRHHRSAPLNNLLSVIQNLG